MRWAGHNNKHGRQERRIRVLVVRTEGKRPLGKLGRRSESDIKMGSQEIGLGHGPN
jgi:hypothetical protein